MISSRAKGRKIFVFVPPRRDVFSKKGQVSENMFSLTIGRFLEKGPQPLYLISGGGIKGLSKTNIFLCNASLWNSVCSVVKDKSGNKIISGHKPLRPWESR